MDTTVWIAAEPCLTGYGKYDMVACNYCAHSGKNQGECCNAIYRNSDGRDDDDDLSRGYTFGSSNCLDIGEECALGQGNCFPGLVCVGSTCKLPRDNPEAHAASSLVTSSSSTSDTTKGGHSFVVVSLLGAAMIAMTVVLQRPHRVLLRRHQYNEVDTNRMDV